ncbi:hypothetical protein V496_02004 [Pseudogymnoascus sp. VKM F-4515 (FW-2607)]|nr:hypothetical protein V496_02004 [Pseudogymnoascus sp. VKM F-4515 (FW-2607)]
MVGAFEHLKVVDLSNEEKDALAECERRLTTLKFKTSRHGYDICDDSAGLETAAKDFIAIFAPWLKFGVSQLQAIQLQAFRFDKAATMPVFGSMLFIPTVIMGSPKISGQALNFGSYVQLNVAVAVEPRVSCLIFRTD